MCLLFHVLVRKRQYPVFGCLAGSWFPLSWFKASELTYSGFVQGDVKFPARSVSIICITDPLTLNSFIIKIKKTHETEIPKMTDTVSESLKL